MCHLFIFIADVVLSCACRDIGDFLSKKHIQYRLGVDPPLRGQTFNGSSRAVNQAFHENLDMFSFPAQYYIAALLERGIRTLIYVGATDYICNWVRILPSSESGGREVDTHPYLCDTDWK